MAHLGAAYFRSFHSNDRNDVKNNHHDYDDDATQPHSGEVNQ
jgi:hypothetical protein